MAGVLLSAITAHIRQEHPQMVTDLVERKGFLQSFFDKEPGFGEGHDFGVNVTGNSSAENISEGQAVTAAVANVIVNATEEYAVYRVTVNLSRRAIRAAAGDFYRFGDLAMSEVELSTRDLVEAIEDDFISGSDTSNPSVQGVTTAISASGTYLGVVRGTYSAWASHSVATIGTLDVATDLQVSHVNLRSSTRKGSPTHILQGGTVFDIAANAVDGTQNTMVLQTDAGPAGLAAIGGYRTYWYKGILGVDVPGYTTQRYDMIQKDDWVIKEQMPMNVEEFTRVGDAIETEVYWAGQLYCRNTGRQGLGSGITA